MSDTRRTPLIHRWLLRGVRPVLHRALLRGLRPARMHHDPPLVQQPCLPGCTLRSLNLHGSRGQRLAAWLALPPGATLSSPVPAVVALHGWGANASTLWSIVAPLVSSGMAVLLVDAASHGDSSDEDFMSLPRFAEDLALAVQSLREQPLIDARRVAVLGHSVGAAATLLHAARGGEVAAVVSLSAFAHPQEVMQRWLDEHHLPRRWVGDMILDHVQQVIGEPFDQIAPLRVMPAVRCPVLLVHGLQDETVPPQDAHRLYALCRQGEMLLVEGDHDLRAALQPHAHTIAGFLARHLGATV